MITANQIKYIKSLKNKKNRVEEGRFVAEGPKVVKELLGSSFRTDKIYALKEWLNENQSFVKECECIEVSPKELGRISFLKTPNSVLGIFKKEDFLLSQDDIKDKLVLALDNISDPGNLGTIIRIADWYDIKNIVCSKECTDIYNPKVIQSAMGSLSRVRVTYCDLQSFFNEYKGVVKVFGADVSGKSINSLEESVGVLLVGNESGGISENLYEFIDEIISIPFFGDNKTDSLNAAVATGIICYQFRMNN